MLAYDAAGPPRILGPTGPRAGAPRAIRECRFFPSPWTEIAQELGSPQLFFFFFLPPGGRGAGAGGAGGRAGGMGLLDSFGYLVKMFGQEIAKAASVMACWGTFDHGVAVMFCLEDRAGSRRTGASSAVWIMEGHARVASMAETPPESQHRKRTLRPRHLVLRAAPRRIHSPIALFSSGRGAHAASPRIVT